MLLTAASAVVACQSGGSSPEPASTAALPSAAPTPTPQPTRGKDAILAIYRELYRVGPQAERALAEQRRAILEPVVTQPLLDTMLKGIEALRARGRVTYGYPILHTFDVQIRGTSAVLHDCQDGSKGGQADYRTGKHLTHGMPGTHMIAAFAKEADGGWRVAKVDQLDTPCSPDT
ncbi:hypothetical protein [Nonomuraea sp. NPDC049607]|uniref:hypothetical protein n=1 Tax=Nonomuraea sp. NPDC049607 TaxID=3154732 RepID=UPI00344947E8